MKKLLILSLFFLGFLPMAISQNKPNASAVGSTPSAALKTITAKTGALKLNVSNEVAFKVPVKTETELNNALNQTTQSIVKTEYIDGFGRVQQTQVRRATLTSKDMVQPYYYDEDGRASIGFLPYPAALTTSGYIRDVQPGLQNAYSALGYTDESYLYQKTVKEASPLGRTLETYAQGNSWVGSNKMQSSSSEYTTTVLVPKFTLGNSNNAIPVYAGTYEQVLEVSKYDEDYAAGKSSAQKQYYNMQGQLVMDKVSSGSNVLLTAYVYDQYNQLRYTITPKAIQAMQANGNVLSAVLVDNLCFRNDYDAYGRLIASKKPEIGLSIVVYDKQNRPVLTQDALQRQSNKWIFVKYDAAGRICQTGQFAGTFTATQTTTVDQDNGTAIVYATGSTVPYTRALLQNLVDASSITEPFLNYLVNTPVYEFAQYQTFAQAEVMQSNIYDQYDQIAYMPFSTNLAARSEGYIPEKSLKIRGLLTGTIAKASDASVNTVRTAYYYNRREEVIQKATRGTNNSLRFMVAGYDFSGRVIKSILRHAQLEVSRKFTYDAYDRLCKIEHKINNSNNYRPIARYYYDDLGRMSVRKLGGMGYNVNYQYNLRNWITGINKSFALTKNNTDYFGMEILYEKGYNQTYLNGRIAGIKWRNKGTASEQRSYGYAYDFAGRLSLGDYYQLSETMPSDWSKAEKDFTTSNIGYDANGNIQSMKHMGLNASKQIIVLDDMVYTYAQNSNRLLGVEETANSQSTDPLAHDGLPDFRDAGTTAGTDYGYDANGNKSSDLNKGISQIDNKWFGLNKPLLIEFSNNNKIEYVYDASGTLLSKKITQASNNKVTKYEYVDEVTYKNGELEGLTHEEGRIRVNPADNTYAYDYFIKDHLSNVRSIITETQVNAWGGDIAIDEIVWPTTTPNSPVYVDGGTITENGMIAGGDGCTAGPVLYLATSELQNDQLEELFFDNLDETRGSKVLSSETTDLKAANLNPNEGKLVGPGILLKVMAGDQLQLGMEALYFNSSTPGSPVPLQNIVSSLVSALSGTGGLMDGVGAANLGSNLDAASMTLAINQLQSGVQDTTKPRAFLNYLAFDEGMQVITEESGAMQVQQANAWGDLSKPLFTVNRSGYIYVYSCNRSEMVVRTDNLFVAHYQGSLLEEFHYYPFGLCFEVSKAPSLSKACDVKYNSQYLDQDEFEDPNGNSYGLESYDFAYRNYDPQIGRWLQPDPMMQHASPYLAMGNNPVSFTDPTGLWDGGPPFDGEIRVDLNGSKFIFNAEYNGWIYTSLDPKPSWDDYDNVSNPFERAFYLSEMLAKDGARYRAVDKNVAIPIYDESINFAKKIGADNWNLAENVASFADDYFGGFIGLSYKMESKTTQVLKYGERVKGITRTNVEVALANKVFAKNMVVKLEHMGKGLGLLGAAFTLLNGASDGNVSKGDWAKVGIQLLSTFGGPVGWAYGLTDLGAEVLTGTSLSDRIGNYIDKP